MIFDLRDAKNLPEHFDSSLRGIEGGTLSAVQSYVHYHNINVSEVSEAFFGEGMGSLDLKTKIAARIAEFLDCPVHFIHNGREGTAFPTASAAAAHDWLVRDAALSSGEKECNLKVS